MALTSRIARCMQILESVLALVTFMSETSAQTDTGMRKGNDTSVSLMDVHRLARLSILLQLITFLFCVRLFVSHHAAAP